MLLSVRRKPRPVAAPPPPVHVAEPESPAVIARIARALPPIERAYAMARFGILRQKLLAMMNLLLPDEGAILDVGCGFGLFSSYLALMAPGRRIVGVDPSARRIRMARKVAQRLALPRQTYLEGTVESARPKGPFDGIFMLDVLHHVPPQAQLGLLADLRRLLAPGGVLVIKEVTTDRPFKLWFTEMLDRAMVGWDEPLAYRHHLEWADHLRELDLHTRVVRVPDILPYPHVVLIARPR
jgi:2-polyprenyl-3-methyl-5-hydroxy-6-metoxy-1,4-benzoquinol methylase